MGGRTRGRVTQPAGWRTPGSPPAPAEPRGSAGHAWSAGFDWAAVVVVTGRRHGCGRTVPGAARSHIPPHSLPFPGFPHRQRFLPRLGAHRSLHGLRPGKDGLGSDSPESVPRAQVRAAPTPGGKWTGVRCPVQNPYLRAPRPGLPRFTGVSGAPSPGAAPERCSPDLVAGTKPLQSRGPQNSRRVSVERLRQNHLGGF